MRILITNDDGFNADGIKSLKKIALEMSAKENIFVVAPSENQSLEINKNDSPIQENGMRIYNMQSQSNTNLIELNMS